MSSGHRGCPPNQHLRQMEEWTIGRNKHFPRELTGVQKWESVCVQWVSRIFECMTVYDMPDTILGRSGRIRQSNLSTN